MWLIMYLIWLTGYMFFNCVRVQPKNSRFEALEKKLKRLVMTPCVKFQTIKDISLKC